MSDTLVERLLNWETIYEEDAKKPEGSLYLEAANRIKKLETQLEQTTEALISIHKALYVETLKQNIKLEEKLAKAVEALDESLYFLQPDERDISKQAGKYRIVKAYEEITGQKYQIDDDKEKNDG